MATNTDVKNVARGLLGTAEDPPGSNHNFITEWYAALINNRGFAHAAWCAMSETYEIHHASDVLAWFVYAYCPYIERDARAGVNGMAWSDDPPADVEGNCVLVLIDFAGHGYATHTGLREVELGDGTRYILEGNIGDAFRREHRDGKYIRGYAIVPLDGVPAVADPGQGNAPAENGRAVMPNLAVGSRGRAVKILEQLVGASVDRGVGIFGPECKRKVTEFQRANGLPVTGRVDARMWWALMQAAFNYIVHTNLDVDGIPGPLSTGALIEFQRSSGIQVDAEAGYETFGTLTGQ